THAKWYQRAAELEGVPMFGLDKNTGPWGGEANEHKLEYEVAQYLEAIDWMEKVTGREYNDELMVEAMQNDVRSHWLWAQICMQNQAIPAPVNERRLYRFYNFGQNMPHYKSTVDLFQTLLDEMKDRVKRGIAGVPTEKFRYMTESQPPWAFLRFYREIETIYGAVSVGSPYVFGLAGRWQFEEDGTRLPCKLPEELGLSISTANSREENIRAYAIWQHHDDDHDMNRSKPHSLIERRNRRMVKLVQDWHVQALIAHRNRGCEMLSLSGPERQQEAREAGAAPRIEVEGSMADPREFDFPREIARVEAFLEGLGCEKLTK
ncbi:2-hydroxyacyl-CoA dehydratase, partial [Chloroflexota bacterium]